MKERAIMTITPPAYPADSAGEQYGSNMATLLAEVRTLLPTNTAEALVRARAALQQATEQDDAEHAAHASLLLGTLMGRRAEFAEAYEHYCRARPILEGSGNTALTAELFRGFSSYYRFNAQYGKAMEYVQRGLALCGEPGMKEQEIDLLIEAAVVCNQASDLAGALGQYRSALAIATQTGDQRRTGLLHAYIGNVYFETQDYTNALDHYLESHRLAEVSGDKYIHQIAVHGIGAVQYGIGDYTKALEYHFRSLALCRELGNRINEANCYGNIGSIHFVLHNYPDALKYYLKTLHMRRSIGDIAGESRALHNIGAFYKELGDTDNARQYYNAAFVISKQTGDRLYQSSQLHSLGVLEMQAGNHNDALAYFAEAYESFRCLELEGRIIHEDFLRLLERMTELYEKTGDIALARRYKTRHHTLKAIVEREQRHKEIRESITRHEIRHILDGAGKAAELINAAETLGKARQVDQPLHAGASTSARTIAVTTFGRFSVSVDGRELTNDDWKRKKSRDVFKVLLLHYGRPMAAEQIAEIVWEDATGKSVRNQFWNAISAIRQALEPDIEKKMPSSYLRMDEGNYMLDLGEDSTIDFIEFRDSIAAAGKSEDEEKRMTLLARAVELYAGDFLKEDTFEEWTSYERESLKESYLNALMELAGNAVDTGKPDTALDYARRALDADRLYEEAYELMITTLLDNDQEAEARKVLEQCSKAFMKELDSAPPRRLVALLGAG